MILYSAGKSFLAFFMALMMTLGIAGETQYHIANIPEKMESAIRVITFNLRNADDLYGSVKGRSQLFSAAILDYMPDSFGVQEATSRWITALDESLGDKYDYVTKMRDDTDNSEASAVFYLKEKYNLIDSGTIWLSETPDVFGSKSFLSSLPRICTWVTLENKQTGETYTHLNTHLDHILESAREQQAQVLLEKAQELMKNGPVVCTGDFNSKENDAAYNVMTSAMKDSKYIAKVSDSGRTYDNYGWNPLAKRPIDFIFVSDSITVDTYKIIDEKINHMYISDHNGLCADIHIG